MPVHNMLPACLVIPPNSAQKVTNMIRRLFLFVLLSLFAPAMTAHCVIADDDETYFENYVRPVFAEYCIECHGSEKQSGGLRLDTASGLLQGGESGAAIDAQNLNSSLLIQVIGYQGDIQMPPKGQLPPAAVDALTKWVQAGAKWPKESAMIKSTNLDRAANHWAFQPVVKPAIPDVDVAAHGIGKDFLQNPIDHFIAERLLDAGLSPSPEAERRTLIRRLSYSLTGLPPTADEVAAFAANESTDAYSQLVDRLLASPAHGAQWARHWLDVARYSDTKGYVYAREERFWIHAWAYRDWVVNSFNTDMPYDRFLMLQIAADQVSDRSEHDLAAMGFLTLGRRFLGVQRDIYDDRIDVVTRGTMSLTVGCARCHDHKYDPIPTADYYSLYGVFASSRENILPLPTSIPADEAFQKELNTRQEKLNSTLQQHRRTTGERVRNRIGDYLRAQFELGKYPEEGFDQVLATSDLLPSFVHRWRDFLARDKRAHHPVFTAWHAFLETGKEASDADSEASPFTLPQDTNPLVAAAFATPPDSRDDMIQRYAALFAEIEAKWIALQKTASDAGTAAPTGLDDAAEEEIRQVMYAVGSPCVVPDEPVVHTEYDVDSGACNELWKLQGEVDRYLINAAIPQPYAVVLEDRAVPITPRIFKRGNSAQKGDEVPRQFLKLLSGPDRRPFQHGSGRYELANAIIDPKNPLTARVIVNRVWAHHFGSGLVATPGDFGTRADLPSHPELLDWLADWFVNEGWSLKKLHRLIVTSGVYRQASMGPVDESQFAAATKLDPSNRLLWRMNTHRLSFEEMRDSMLAVSNRLDRSLGGRPADLFKAPFPVRRTLYGLIDRQFLPGTLRMFDFANPDLHIPQRSDTTVPQQALFLMNHESSLQQSRELSRLIATGTDQHAGVASMVSRLYQQVLQRNPTSQQLEDATAFLQSAQALPEDSPPSTAVDWSYGFGKYDEPTQRVSGFSALPHFTGTAWQGAAAWPDAALGWVQLTATGGHPGNDRDHASIRRWTAPRAMTVRIESQVVHEAEPGDGIRTFVISSNRGLLQSASVHKKTVDLNVDAIELAAGETLDFVCDIGDVLNSDQHFWRIKIHEQAVVAETKNSETWNSESDFTQNTTQHLSPLEQLAQVLLCSNEFLFVD